MYSCSSICPVPGRQCPGARPWCPSPSCRRQPPNLHRRGSHVPLWVLLPFGNAVWLTEFLDFCFSPQQGKSQGGGPALGTRNTLAPGAWPLGCPRRLRQRTRSPCPPPHPARPCCDVCTHYVSFGLSLPWTFREENLCQSALPREGAKAPDCLRHPFEDPEP